MGHHGGKRRMAEAECAQQHVGKLPSPAVWLDLSEAAEHAIAGILNHQVEVPTGCGLRRAKGSHRLCRFFKVECERCKPGVSGERLEPLRVAGCPPYANAFGE